MFPRSIKWEKGEKATGAGVRGEDHVGFGLPRSTWLTPASRGKAVCGTYGSWDLGAESLPGLSSSPPCCAYMDTASRW